jgi:DNA ligase-1
MPNLIEGAPVYIQGSGAKPYELKNVGGIYSCSCPAWRNQSEPINRRTCKHLRAHCGSASEDARIAGKAAPSPGPANDVVAEERVVRATPEEAQRILDRAAEQGRKLRQDEKTKLNGPPLLLAHQFSDFEIDPTGWWMSEKLDGNRGYWDGKRMVSRQGNVFSAPDFFRKGLPDVPLDGELWMGRGNFQDTGIVRADNAGVEWEKVVYLVFDLPSSKEPFEARMAELKRIFAKNKPQFARVHEHIRCEGNEHLTRALIDVTEAGGEGMMLRKPGSLYVARRSETLLKVIRWKEEEGVVVAHLPGKGRHKGSLGAITLRLPNGIEFDVGTGFSDKERRTPPKMGALVTFKYGHKTRAGKPLKASFVRVRDYE